MYRVSTHEISWIHSNWSTLLTTPASAPTHPSSASPIHYSHHHFYTILHADVLHSQQQKQAGVRKELFVCLLHVLCMSWVWWSAKLGHFQPPKVDCLLHLTHEEQANDGATREKGRTKRQRDKELETEQDRDRTWTETCLYGPHPENYVYIRVSMQMSISHKAIIYPLPPSHTHSRAHTNTKTHHVRTHSKSIRDKLGRW